MEVHGETLYDLWKGVNNRFIKESPLDAYLCTGRDFSIARYNVRLHANSLLLPNEWPPLFTKRRLTILDKRYKLHQDDIERLRKSSGGSYPKSFSLLFRREETTERGIPSGGGCLISIVFTKYNGRWHVHVLSRASEISVRLLSDMYFIRQKIDEVTEEVNLQKKGWDPAKVSVTWTLLLPAQMKYMVPIYLYLTHGEDYVVDYLTQTPAHKWQWVVQEHFWNVMISPENIKWQQRKRWCDKFLDWTDTDWKDLYQKKKTTIEENLSLY